MPHYRHTQVGYLQIFVFGGAVVGLAWIIHRHAAPLILYLLLPVMLFVLFFFSTLTVQIDDESLSFWFNIGWFRRDIALLAIQHHFVAKSSAREGWGIRFTPIGKLYNVSGLDCLVVLSKGGERTRIGTDEPEELQRRLGYAMARIKVRGTKGLSDSEPGPFLHPDAGIEGE